MRNVSRDAVLASRVGVADSFWLRLRGLLGRPPLERGEGLLITPCRGVHMLGMRYAIDVVFIDRDGRVAGVAEGLEPGAKSAWYRTARHALELPAGTVAETGTVAGDRVEIEAAASGTFATRTAENNEPERTTGAS